MNKLVLFLGLLLVSCASLQPSSRMIIHPTPTPMPTLAMDSKPIGEAEREDAFDFFYRLKIHMALGEFEHFAEKVRYPITVHVDGQPKVFVQVAEMDANFEKIFSDEEIQKFIATDESELTFTPDGVKVADGIIWFDLICTDPACSATAFLITEIN